MNFRQGTKSMRYGWKVEKVTPTHFSFILLRDVYLYILDIYIFFRPPKKGKKFDKRIKSSLREREHRRDMSGRGGCAKKLSSSTPLLSK